MKSAKFIAGAFDRLSTGFVLAGVFAPLYTITQGQSVPAWQELVGVVCWFFGALVPTFKGASHDRENGRMTPGQWLGFVILPGVLTLAAYVASLVFERLNPQPAPEPGLKPAETAPSQTSPLLNAIESLVRELRRETSRREEIAEQHSKSRGLT